LGLSYPSNPIRPARKATLTSNVRISARALTGHLEPCVRSATTAITAQIDSGQAQAARSCPRAWDQGEVTSMVMLPSGTDEGSAFGTIGSKLVPCSDFNDTVFVGENHGMDPVAQIQLVEHMSDV